MPRSRHDWRYVVAGSWQERWTLAAIVIDHLGVSHVIAGLGMSWHTANDAVLTEGHRLLINDETRLNGVRVVGVDEHV